MGRGESEAAERRARQTIAVSFYALAAYVVVESVRSFTGVHPDASWVGIGLAAVTAPTISACSLAPGSGSAGGSGRVQLRARVSDIVDLAPTCSVALLVGLGANALLGWWWAGYPLAGLVIADVAVREGREA